MMEGYKMTEIGELSDDWEVVELNEISNITRLAGYEYSEYWIEDLDGSIMALRGYNIGKNKIIFKDIVKISNELSLKLNRSRLYKGDIAFPCVGTIGNAVLIEENDKFHINQNIAKITPYDVLEPLYLVQYLISDLCKKEINRFNATTSQPNVLVGSLRKFRIPFPPFSEQQKIAEILTTVDDKIEIINTQIIQTQELKKGLMQQLLTWGIGHTKFKDSELGEIPYNWKISKLIDLSVDGICNGTFNDPKKIGSGFKIINVVNMYSGHYINTDELQLLNIDENEFNRNRVYFGDVFFTRSSLVAEGIAHCNVNLSNDSNITFDGHLMKIRPNQNEVVPQFLNYICKTNKSRSFFIARGKTATMTTIGQKDIADLQLAIPSIEEQHKIVNIISTIEDKIDSLNIKINAFILLKKGLMQQLLTGKIRVK